MKRIKEVLGAIKAPPALEPDERARLPSPRSGLGALGVLGERLRAIFRARAEIGGSPEATVPLRKLLLIAAADHGVARAGVSRYPQATTTELVRDVLAGRAVVARLAPILQARAIVADFGLAADEDLGRSAWADFERLRIAPGTADISEGPAMSRETALKCVHAGVSFLDRSCEGWDVDIVGLGDLGLGSTTSACAISAALTGLPVERLCRGRMRGLGPVRKALERTSPDPDDALAVLSEYGGLETGALAGICLAAAARRVPVLLDGAVSAAAAALAVKLAPAARAYLVASHEAAIPAHGVLLESLGLEPLLKLRLDLGEGAGAVLAMNLVEAAWVLASGRP